MAQLFTTNRLGRSRADASPWFPRGLVRRSSHARETSARTACARLACQQQPRLGSTANGSLVAGRGLRDTSCSKLRVRRDIHLVVVASDSHLIVPDCHIWRSDSSLTILCWSMPRAAAWHGLARGFVSPCVKTISPWRFCNRTEDID